MLSLDRFLKLSILITFVGNISLPCIALAQDEIGPTAQTQAIDQQVIEEIFVTATRREASVPGVPFTDSGLVIGADEPISAIDKPPTLSARYYPLTIGNEYYYKAVKPNAPNRELRVKAEIKNLQIVDGEDYFYLFSPRENIRYLIRRDKAGVYMRLLKRKFPLFGLSFDVHLKPEILFLRFPLAIDDKWSQRVTASARLFFIPFSRRIEARYHVVDQVILHTEAGDINAFVVNASLGVVGGAMASKTFWYGENVGYIKGSAPEDSMIIVGYRVFDEQNGLWIDKSPPDAGHYK